MKLPDIITERDISALRKCVRTEAIACFVIIRSSEIIIEYSASVLGPSGLVDQVTDLVVLALPKPAYSTMIPIPVPKLRVDMARLV